MYFKPLGGVNEWLRSNGRISVGLASEPDSGSHSARGNDGTWDLWQGC